MRQFTILKRRMTDPVSGSWCKGVSQTNGFDQVLVGKSVEQLRLNFLTESTLKYFEQKTQNEIYSRAQKAGYRINANALKNHLSVMLRHMVGCSEDTDEGMVQILSATLGSFVF